jgi:uncharacterized protein (TIGR00251 family)
MLKVTENPDSLDIDVIAKPKASRNKIEGVHDGALKISVTAAPEKGKANDAIIGLLSKKLKIPKSAITVLRGETSRKKKLRIEGITRDRFLRIVGADR